MDRPAGIVDLARVFNEETKTQLESELKAFEQRSGIAIIVETETYIDSGVSTVDHCKRLQSEWLPTRAGIIICHNRADSNAPEVLFSPALEQRFSAIQLSKANDNSLREVAGITEARERLSKRIKSLMAQLLPLAEEDASGSRMLLYREDLFLAGGVALFLLLACLFHLLLSVGKSSGDLHSATQVYLPDVEVGQRFGATCGGGVMASTEVQQ